MSADDSDVVARCYPERLTSPELANLLTAIAKTVRGLQVTVRGDALVWTRKARPTETDEQADG